MTRQAERLTAFDRDLREFLGNRAELHMNETADLAEWREIDRRIDALAAEIEALLPSDKRCLMAQLSDLYIELIGVETDSIFERGIQDGARIFQTLEVI